MVVLRPGYVEVSLGAALVLLSAGCGSSNTNYPDCGPIRLAMAKRRNVRLVAVLSVGWNDWTPLLDPRGEYG